MKISIGRPSFGKEELKVMGDVLRSQWILNGPKVLEFENKFRERTGAEFAASVTSCTAGMHLALAALNVEGGEVILPAFNFIGAGLAVLQAGAKPVFADVDSMTYTIDPKEIEKKITGKTRAIFVLHYAGLPADMDPILEIAAKYKIPVVEDAAHALGAEYKDRKVGTMGKATIFSFGPVKAITTGMGGMITTSDKSLDNNLRVLRSYGMNRSAWGRRNSNKPWRYQVNQLGHNFRMTEISAALGLVQLDRLGNFLSKRRKLSSLFTKTLSSIPGVTPPKEPIDYLHAFLYYVVRINKRSFGISRDSLAKRLIDLGIGVSVHWDPPLHLHNIFKKFGYKKTDFKVSERLSRELLTLPMHPKLTYKDIGFIVECIKGHGRA
ncbi:DegT/DnrJ/EryC1/StrS family aminotransferase [Thermodesulfobacteriota bacterium]